MPGCVLSVFVSKSYSECEGIQPLHILYKYMQHHWKLIGALLFLLIAGMIAFRSLWVSRPAQEARRIVLENADTAALSTALFSPIEDLGGVDAFIESLRPRLEQAATEAGAPTGSERAYVDIVCARL